MSPAIPWLARIVGGALYLFNATLAVTAWRRGLHEGALLTGVCDLAALYTVTRIESDDRP